MNLLLLTLVISRMELAPVGLFFFKEPVSLAPEEIRNIARKSDLYQYQLSEFLKDSLRASRVFRDVVTITNKENIQIPRYVLYIDMWVLNKGRKCCIMPIPFLKYKMVYMSYYLRDEKNEDKLLAGTLNRRLEGNEKVCLGKMANELKDTVVSTIKSYRNFFFEEQKLRKLRGKISTSILPFTSSGREAKEMGLGESFSAMLSTGMKRKTCIEVVEREKLEKIVEELKLELTGLITPEQIKQIGKMLGVDYIITGSITKIQSKIEVDVKLIDVETARVIYSDYDQILRPNHLRFLADDVLYKILKYLVKKYGER